MMLKPPVRFFYMIILKKLVHQKRRSAAPDLFETIFIGKMGKKNMIMSKMLVIYFFLELLYDICSQRLAYSTLQQQFYHRNYLIKSLSL